MNCFCFPLGCIPAAVGLIVLAYVPKNLIVVESILVIVCSFKIATHVGVYVSEQILDRVLSYCLICSSNFFCSAYPIWNVFRSYFQFFVRYTTRQVSSASNGKQILPHGTQNLLGTTPCSAHEDIRWFSLWPVTTVIPLSFKPEHCRICSLLLGDRLTGNIVVPPLADARKQARKILSSN